MLKKQEKDKFSFTVCEEFFPEVFPASRSEKWSRGEEDPLVTEMRLFCACMRWAFNRLLEGNSRDEIKKLGQELFGINSRYADDARLKAQGLLDSRKELLALEIKETEKKLARAKKKLSLTMKKLAKAEKRNDAPEIIGELRLAVKGRNNRVASLEKKLAGFKTYRESGSMPKIVFGGRKLWEKVCKGRITREEWQAVRRNRLYSRGDETKGGNPNVKVSYADGEFRMAVTVSHLSQQAGMDRLGRPKKSRAPRVEGKLFIPDRYRDLVRVWLVMKLPYTVELIRTPEGKYVAHLTFELGEMREPDFAKGCLALDTNPDGVALCNVNACGQPEPWPEGFSVTYPSTLHKYKGEFQVITYPNGFLYIRVPDLTYASGYRRSYLIGVLAKAVVDVAFFLGKPVTLEKLDFGKDRLDTNKKFNRMASNFPFAKMVEAVCRRARKEEVSIKIVPAQHTSTIGYWKYMGKYGVPIHCAAALVIGRRGMGFKEKVTKELKQLLEHIKEGMALEVNSDIPREGKGMTRKVRACLKRLDDKVPVQNGLSRWWQEGYYSVWHDFRLLALSLR